MPKPVSGKRPAEEAPSTPSQSSVPSTPTGEAEVEPKKQKKQRKGAEEQVPLTPVQKAKDMCAKLLKKKNDASNLTLTLQSLPYAQALSAEMQKFATQFESFGCFCCFFAAADTNGFEISISIAILHVDVRVQV